MGSAQGNKHHASLIIIDMNPVPNLKRLLQQNSDTGDKVGKRRLSSETDS